MAEKNEAAAVKTLAEKGNGVLTRAGGVWTYPGCPMDPSGTNLRLPLEYVSDAEVQAALRGGDLQAVTQTPSGEAMSVRIIDPESAAAVLSTAQAGTAEAGTELPPGSRPSHDAGTRAVSAEEAAAVAARSLATITNPKAAAKEAADEKAAREQAAATGSRKGR